MTAALAATTGDAPDTPTGDRLVILGDTTGAQTLDLTIAAPPPAADALPLDADALRHLVTIHAPAPAATLTGTLVHGDFTYTLQQTPEGAITLRLHGFNPALGSKTEPALQTVTASHALSLEARGIDTNPDPLPPLIWQRLTPGDTTWTTLTGATVTGARLWLKNIPLAHDGVSYRHIVQNTPGAPVTSLPATLRVVPELTIPAGIAAAPDGALYIANPRDHLIQKVTPAPASNTNATPTIHTLAGAPAQPGSTDAAPPTAARFRSPQGIAITPAGDIYIADTGNHTIRRITNATAAASNNNATTRAVTLYAGAPAQSGSTDGEALSARFNAPAAIAATPAGDTLYIADTGNHTIRRITITPTRVTVTLFAGAPGKPGSDDNTTGAHARFRSPQGIALSAAGDIYVADTENAAIRKITPAAAVTTLGAGTPGGTTLVAPRGLAVDDTRHLLYISDADTHAIYVSDIGPGPFGGGRIIVPLAGAELDPDIRDALTGAAARFNAPWGLALDATGALHIADHANAALRQLAPTGAVTTLILTATTEPNNNGGGGGGTSGGGGSGSGGGGTSGGGGGGTSGGGGGGGGGAPMPAVLALLAALLLSRALTRPRPPA
jgi:sugar lactone lactonase YvrE